MEISPGAHLLRDSVNLGRPCASLQELPFRKTKMLGELCYTSQNRVPEGISVDLQIFTSHHFFLSEDTWTCMKGKGISCVCSYSLRPFDFHETPRDIRFRPKHEQKSYKVKSFYVEMLTATNFSDKKLLRMSMSPRSGYGNEVSFSPIGELKPTPPKGLFQTSFFGTHFTYTDLQFPTKPGMGNHYHKRQRYRMLLVLLADIGGEDMIPVAVCESETLKVLDTDD